MSINDQQVSDYQTNGFVVLQNIFSDWIPTFSRGADVNAAHPSDRALFHGDDDVRTWAIEPGDAVAFNFKTIHGAKANDGDTISRTVSFRLVGDDVRYFERPGRTSPNFQDINQKSDSRLREDWFPVIWPTSELEL